MSSVARSALLTASDEQRRESAEAVAVNSCDYCGLPLSDGETRAAETRIAEPRPAESRDADARTSEAGENGPSDDGPRYCCYGCRFAATVTAAQGDAALARSLMTRLGLALFFTMNVMVFTMFLWSQQEGEPLERGAATFYSLGRYVCLLFSAPVLLLLGGPLVEDAAAELKRGRPSISGLLAVGVLAAFGYSLVSVFRGAGDVYFEVSCMVLVAVTLGRWLEANGKLKTTAALRALQRLLPDQVRVIREGVESMVAREAVQPGDCVRVVAGERLPVDGVVSRNRASVDEQAVTGESVPVVKEPGDAVYSGTLNLDGDLWIEAKTGADGGTMQNLIAAVERAVATQDRYQRLATRIAAWFLPIVAVIAVGTLGFHWYRTDLGAGLLASLAVIVIACPCALGLATPMALWAAVGRAARSHVLLRDGDTLIRLAAARVFCFDKTGTLTTGQVEVWRMWIAPGEDETTVREIAMSLASASTHPLADAIRRHGEQRGWRPARIADPRLLAGRGVIGRVESGRVVGGRVESGQLSSGTDAYLGSRRLMSESGACEAWDERQSAELSAAAAEHPFTFIGWDGRVRGAIALAEQVRPGVRPALAWLSEHGRTGEILTGDQQPRAARLASELGVGFHAELLPENKLTVISEHVASGRGVVMVGDGINDTPALAAADVGIALGCGADVSRYTAGVCLLGDDLAVLPWLVQLAEQTVRTVRWNLFWAFAYNTAGIAIAAAGWLNPIVAALAMTISSLMVVSNSLRLGRGEETEVR
ncbi:MAG TPA: cation-translocating P-type ATPase [Pirellulaceae bacterium]|nr:cation-translocating P-type ATPase [Pirellulaceae bacterium]